MSLDWDATRTALLDNERRASNVSEDMARNIIHSLVFATMSTGINEITEDNADKFYQRLNMVERVLGHGIIVNNEPYFITKDDVKGAIGLRTSASHLTDAQFLKNLFDGHKRWNCH